MLKNEMQYFLASIILVLKCLYKLRRSVENNSIKQKIKHVNITFTIALTPPSTEKHYKIIQRTNMHIIYH